MALPFPIVPVLIGAAVGAAITYVLTKARSRRDIMGTLEELEDTVSDSVAEAKDTAAKGVDEATKAAKKTVSKAT
jgi:hypothetical protein